MTIVQPGQVPTYTPDPAVTLSSYSDSDRTRFLFNGSQFIKARLAVSRASYVSVGTAPLGLGYSDYKNSAGVDVLVDGNVYVPVATGAPPDGYAQAVVVGFPINVTTASIVFWSTSFIDYYTSFIVEYSYDGDYYFTVPTVNTTWEWDATAQLVADEDPATGQYKFTLALDTTYSAKYFRISAYHTTLLDTTFTSGSTTIGVSSTAGFPAAWSDSTGISLQGTDGAGHTVNSAITYTGKTEDTFTGVNLITPFAYDVIVDSTSKVLMKPDYAADTTEIDVLGTYSPILEVWDTDGGQASSQVLTNNYNYDICFDTASDVYFSIRLNSDLDGTGGPGFSISDDFTYTSSVLNTTRWEESSTENRFGIDPVSGTLVYVNSTAAGRIKTNYYLDGDFTSDVHVYADTIVSSSGVCQMSAVDESTNNTFVQVGLMGPMPGGNWEAIQARKTVDTTGGAADINNLRIDMSSLSASETFTFVYNSTVNLWSITTDLSTVYSDVTPGEDYTDKALSMSIVHNSTPLNGAQIQYNINRQETPLPAAADWWRIGLEKTGSDIVCRYDESLSSFVDWVTYNDPDDLNLRIEIHADGVNEDVSISLDNYTASGTEYFNDIPVFSIESLDSSGDPVEVSGLTDSDGYLIKRFDVVNDTLTYNSFIGDRVQIATDSLGSGAVYIKVKDDLYKYNKSLLPLDLENGSNATVFKEEVIPETTAKAFSYNSYSNAGLCYVEYDGDRDGTYLKTISTTTMSGTEYEAYLDITTASYPFGWDQNNYTILYYVDGTSLKEYDMDEADVAFCNVVSTEKIMSAGTSTTSAVTATVLNVYGEPLSAKTVAFTVSAGDGAMTGTPACTTASGVASATYTVGTTVGTTTITATASDVAC